MDIQLGNIDELIFPMSSYFKSRASILLYSFVFCSILISSICDPSTVEWQSHQSNSHIPVGSRANICVCGTVINHVLHRLDVCQIQPDHHRTPRRYDRYVIIWWHHECARIDKFVIHLIDPLWCDELWIRWWMCIFYWLSQIAISRSKIISQLTVQNCRCCLLRLFPSTVHWLYLSVENRTKLERAKTKSKPYSVFFLWKSFRLCTISQRINFFLNEIEWVNFIFQMY